MAKFFAVKAYGNDLEKLKQALGLGIGEAKSTGSTLTLLVPKLNGVEDTILSDVLGNEVVHLLSEGNHLARDSYTLIMCSTKTIDPFSEQGVVVALWGGRPMLKKVDQCTNA